MEEKMKELYQEYLKEKLDLVFDKEVVEKENDFDKIIKYFKYVLNYEIIDIDEISAQVKKDGKYYVIDRNGKLNSNKWYDTAKRFRDGYALIIEDEKCNYINKQGNLLSKEWYDEAYSFSEGLARVKKNCKYNFIDKQGNLLSKEWYYEAYSFSEGLARVEKNGKYNFIDKQKKLISGDWYDQASDFRQDIALVEKNGKYNYIDRDGKLINKKWFKSEEDAFNNARTYFKNIIFDSMTNYSVKKKVFGGYKCFNSYDSFSIKYKPIKDYENIYILCTNEDNFYLYNRKTKEYEDMGTNVIYNDSFIYQNPNVYFMYNDKKIDITNYYNKYLSLIDTNNLNITQNIAIMTRVDFDYLNSDEKKKFLEEEKEKNKKIREQQLKEKQEKDIQNAKELKEQEQEKMSQELIETLKTLKDSINKLNELKSRLGNIKIPKITVDNVLIEVDDHKEIMEELKDKLQFIDLSTISFKDVDIQGIDFRGCNMHLYPQEVYKRNLKECDFTGMNIDPFMNFRGVDIRGAKFSIDNDPSTLDLRPKFTGAIYDETTTYNGKSLVDILGPCEEINDKRII